MEYYNVVLAVVLVLGAYFLGSRRAKKEDQDGRYHRKT